MQVRCCNCFCLYEDEFDMCPHCGYVVGDPATELFHLYPGMILSDRYIVGEVLGFGGFGIIYKVWDKQLDNIFAIKEYYPSRLVNRVPGAKEVTLFTDKRAKEYVYGLRRFLDEARNTAKFNSHKSIVNVFGYFEENNTAYIVMEFLPGFALSKYLKDTHMSVDTSITIITGVCAALKDIHAAGILHRDVSPDNIFICDNGVIKLIDFGAARFSADEEKLLTIVLKPGFAPPEQYETVNVQGPWTDIYALGGTFYQMLTGVKPEESTNRKTSDTLAAPIELNNAIPEHISNTIMKAMAIDRHLRFSSISEFEKALNHEKKVLPVAKEKKRRKRRRFTTVLASALIVAISASVFLYSLSRQRERETLPDAAISIWYPLPGNPDADAAKTEALEAVIAAFHSNFPNIAIDVEAYPQEDYAMAILDAIADEEGPVLFESTGMGDEILCEAVDLANIAEVLDGEECYFLNRYERYFPKRDQLPLGFVAPAFYLNKTLLKPDGDGIEDPLGLINPADDSIETLVIDSAHLPAFVSAYGETAFTSTDSAKELFLSGQANAYFADTSVFFEVQDTMSGSYALAYVARGSVPGTFSDLWSIGPCGENAQKAAEKFLLFMLTDNAQDHMYLRYHGGALPVNQNVLTEFTNVYNDFDGFFDNIKDYEFEAR